MSVDTNISATEDLLGKVVADLQENISIADGAITGTLKYQSDYTGFSSKVEEQTGNFIAIHADVEEGTKVTVTVTNPVVLDPADNIVILRIADKDSQTITVVAEKEGCETNTKVFSLTGLTCLTA